MTNWIETADGTLIPSHQVAKIRVHERDRGPSTITTVDGERYNIFDYQLPSTETLVVNANQDLRILYVAAGECEGKEWVEAWESPLVGWRLQCTKGEVYGLPVGIEHNSAGNVRSGVVESTTGRVFDEFGWVSTTEFVETSKQSILASERRRIDKENKR